MPITTTVTRRNTPDTAGVDWNRVCQAVQAGFQESANTWISLAKVRKGVVAPPHAAINPGNLQSGANMTALLRAKLVQPGYSETVMEVFCTELGSVWDATTAGVGVLLAGAFVNLVGLREAPRGPVSPVLPAYPLGTTAAMAPTLTWVYVRDRVCQALRATIPRLQIASPEGQMLQGFANHRNAARRGEDPRPVFMSVAEQPPDPHVERLAKWIENSWNYWSPQVTLRNLESHGGSLQDALSAEQMEVLARISPAAEQFPRRLLGKHLVGAELRGDYVLSHLRPFGTAIFP